MEKLIVAHPINGPHNNRRTIPRSLVCMAVDMTGSYNSNLMAGLSFIDACSEVREVDKRVHSRCGRDICVNCDKGFSDDILLKATMLKNKADLSRLQLIVNRIFEVDETVFC